MVITNWITNLKAQTVPAMPPTKAKNIPLIRVAKAIEVEDGVEAVEVRGCEATEARIQIKLPTMMQ